MSEPSNLIVREYEPGDEEAILAGFNNAFARIDSSFEPRTLAEWRWRYLENPSGWRIWLGLTEDGRVVNQQGGIPLRVLQDGQVQHWTQIVDTFTDPDLGRGLKKPGLFVLAARPFLDHYAGASPKDTVMYGLPVKRAWRIGKKFLTYEAIRNQNKLSLSPGQFVGEASTAADVEEVDAFPEEVDALFERAAEGVGATTVRDLAHVTWRFCGRPNVTYRIALARRTSPGRELCGYAVYRRSPFDLREDGLICDWLVPEGEEGAAHALRAWLASRARADGVDYLTVLFPDTSRDWLPFQRAGFRVQPTQYFMGCRSYMRPYDERWLYWNWSYTLADFDQC